ncbi:MAG: LutB/LldF family L-lactate oxidation iron-sulfur protein [Actinomycetia bacterium]|nr:LutB/LldF family L-lactate oxidation iron-sulfur protein [Actinomycetes bacterium]
MGELTQPAERFRSVAREKLADQGIQAAVDSSTDRLRTGRLRAWNELDDVERLRDAAHDVRMRAVRDLDRYLAQFTSSLEARGGHVAVCATPEEACGYIVDVCRARGATLVAKAKSMVAEEIELNAALEAAGIKPVETDLGEYILQLEDEHPVHIIAPAIEKTKEDVARLFSRVEGREIEPELEELTLAARRQLRQVFMDAEVGITGANFLVAETGTIVTVTNEGNARFVSSLPPVHIAVTGIERLVPTLADLAPLLTLLGRSGTGQRLTSYTQLITGARREGEEDGPEDLHIVLIENGRRNLLGTRYEEMLACIRCGACLNVCPVYRKTAGSAYGPVYSGPMGAVLAPLLVGIEQAPSLPHASSLCGACTEACPVKIPLHELLLELRRDLVEETVASRRERLAFALWSLAWSRPAGYRLSTRLARLAQRLVGRVGPGRSWTAGRALPVLPRQRFRDGRA